MYIYLNTYLYICICIHTYIQNHNSQILDFPAHRCDLCVHWSLSGARAATSALSTLQPCTHGQRFCGHNWECNSHSDPINNSAGCKNGAAVARGACKAARFASELEGL